MTRRATEAEVKEESQRPNGKSGDEGERRETSTASGPLKAGGRWNPRRKKEVVLRLLRGEPIDGVSREIGVQVYRLERWKGRALAGMEGSLKKRQSSREQSLLDDAMKRVGELTMENELLWKRVGSKPGPLARRRSSR
jgi:transposase